MKTTTLIVINKPPGLVVHPGSGNWQGTMLNALLHHADALAALPRAGIVHRLDKDTSGLLVIAKTLTAQTDLVRQLQAAHCPANTAPSSTAWSNAPVTHRGRNRPRSAQPHSHGRGSHRKTRSHPLLHH